MTLEKLAAKDPYTRVRIIIPYIAREETSYRCDPLRATMGFLSLKEGDEKKLLKLFSGCQKRQDPFLNSIITIPKGTIIIIPKEQNHTTSSNPIRSSTYKVSNLFKCFLECFPCRRS